MEHSQPITGATNLAKAKAALQDLSDKLTDDPGLNADQKAQYLQITKQIESFMSLQ